MLRTRHLVDLRVVVLRSSMYSYLVGVLTAATCMSFFFQLRLHVHVPARIVPIPPRGHHPGVGTADTENAGLLTVDGDARRLRNSATFGLPNTKPEQPNAQLADELLQKFGIVQYHVYRPTRDIPTKTKLPMAMVVHHRETSFGCHSFERFFNPNWETIVVVEEDMADQFQLKQLANAASSVAIHLALLSGDKVSGEWLGRQVALHILNFEHEHGMKSMAPLLFSTQCDVHPLPSYHSLHKPYGEIVERMVHLFLEEDRLNQKLEQQTNAKEYTRMGNVVPLNRTMCEPIFNNKDRPLLVLNTVMLETLPSTKTLKGSKFHGMPVGLASLWSDRSSKEILDNKPWMSDVSTWVEDHFSLYNATLLTKIVGNMSQVDATVAAGVRSIAQLMCRNKWKAARLNDEPMFLDFAKPQLVTYYPGAAGSVPLFDASKYGTASIDWLFRRSMLGLASVNSPLGCLREYMALRIHANVDIKSGCIIAHAHLQPDHVPEDIWSNNVGRNEDIFEAFMQLHGYELMVADEDHLTFVRVPTFHSVPHELFLDSLKEGTNGIVSGSVYNEMFWYIQLPRNSTIQKYSIFSGSGLRSDWMGIGGLREYSIVAERICTFINSKEKPGQEFSPFSKVQVSGVLNVIRRLCLPGYEWHSHAPLTGGPDEFDWDDGGVHDWWDNLANNVRAAASLLGFDEEMWDGGEPIPLYAKALDELSDTERRAASLLRLEDKFSLREAKNMK